MPHLSEPLPTSRCGQGPPRQPRFRWDGWPFPRGQPGGGCWRIRTTPCALTLAIDQGLGALVCWKHTFLGGAPLFGMSSLLSSRAEQLLPKGTKVKSRGGLMWSQGSTNSLSLAGTPPRPVASSASKHARGFLLIGRIAFLIKTCFYKIIATCRLLKHYLMTLHIPQDRM